MSTLSKEQIDHYRTEGYLVESSLFSRDEVNHIKDAIRDLTLRTVESGNEKNVMELEPESINGERVARRIFHPFEQDEDFQKMAKDPRIVDRIVSLIGPNLSLHHSKLNLKPAKVGSVVEWHQDLAYFPHTNDDLVTTLIYLDDTTVENGCLQVMPRQHKHYFDHRLPDGSFAGMITETIGDGLLSDPVSLPAPAGSVIFMHCITPHSSLPNRSDSSRRTLIFEYRAADSFPIYFGNGDYIDFLEEHAHHLQGEPARFARFGGPPAMIPHMSTPKSLYTLQDEAKEKGQTPSLAETASS